SLVVPFRSETIASRTTKSDMRMPNLLHEPGAGSRRTATALASGTRRTCVPRESVLDLLRASGLAGRLAGTGPATVVLNLLLVPAQLLAQFPDHPVHAGENFRTRLMRDEVVFVLRGHQQLDHVLVRLQVHSDLDHGETLKVVSQLLNLLSDELLSGI